MALPVAPKAAPATVSPIDAPRVNGERIIPVTARTPPTTKLVVAPAVF